MQNPARAKYLQVLVTKMAKREIRHNLLAACLP